MPSSARSFNAESSCSLYLASSDSRESTERMMKSIVLVVLVCVCMYVCVGGWVVVGCCCCRILLYVVDLIQSDAVRCGVM